MANLEQDHQRFTESLTDRRNTALGHVAKHRKCHFILTTAAFLCSTIASFIAGITAGSDVVADAANRDAKQTIRAALASGEELSEEERREILDNAFATNWRSACWIVSAFAFAAALTGGLHTLWKSAEHYANANTCASKVDALLVQAQSGQSTRARLDELESGLSSLVSDKELGPYLRR